MPVMTDKPPAPKKLSSELSDVTGRLTVTRLDVVAESMDITVHLPVASAVEVLVSIHQF